MAADGKVVCMVTGGSGLYGMAIRAHVAQSAEEKDATWVFLSSKDGDLRDRKATEAIFERVRPTHVIHLAAMVGGLFANMSKKVEFYRENMWPLRGSFIRAPHAIIGAIRHRRDSVVVDEGILTG